MRRDHHYDVIIIGSGAGGGTIAHQLAPSGKRILLLERGDFVPREPDNWSSKAAVLDEKYHAPEQWVDSDGKPFSPGTHYNVGGNTKFYGAALFRMREEDFGEIKHAGGISPAWPIAYEDLEPYYTQAEWLYEVRGERGKGGVIQLSRGPVHRIPRQRSRTSRACSSCTIIFKARASSHSTSRSACD
jgi:choline dehydrogenase-like flavoprotein